MTQDERLRDEGRQAYLEVYRSDVDPLHIFIHEGRSIIRREEAPMSKRNRLIAHLRSTLTRRL